MKIIALALACLALAVGLAAAWYWYRSSQVVIDPGWKEVEPGDAGFSAMGWTVGTMVSFNKVSRLNKLASILSAISLMLGGASSIVGALP